MKFPRVTAGRHCRRFYSFESWDHAEKNARYLTLLREAIPRHRAAVTA